MTWLPHYIIFQIRKLIYRPDVIGVGKRGGAGSPPSPPIKMPPMIKNQTTKSIVYSISGFSCMTILMLTTREPGPPQLKILSINLNA